MPRYLGQHFLLDKDILQAIVESISGMIKKHDIDVLREIWPGQGALTKHIYKLASDFRCYEKDETMKKYLGQFLQWEDIIWWDVLQWEIKYTKPTIVVGNLPYYITSPIFRKFFAEDISPVWGVFLIQKEVAEKIMTWAKKKSYLRWLLNNRYSVEYLCKVPPEAFDPPPKVDSVVISFHRREASVCSSGQYENMLLILDTISGYKRKTLGKIQKICQKNWKDIHIPKIYHGMRLEELGWEEMKDIVEINYER